MTRHPLPDICSHVVVDEDAIARRVAELGAELSRDLAGEDVTLVSVLRGGLFFLADLSRALTLDPIMDFIAVAPYVPGGAPGVVRLTKDLDDDIEGRAVVLVEDVVDTGLTVNYVLSLLAARRPKRLLLCTLLDKPARRIAEVDIAYTGFELSDDFLVGYGLDVRGRYRNLPYVAAVRHEVVLR